MGEEIIKTALLIKAPTQGKELYETVNLQAQVNTSMGIEKLSFYLDEINDDHKIADITCNQENSYYEYHWDTTKTTDGTHKIYAAVYKGDGTQVEDTR